MTARQHTDRRTSYDDVPYDSYPFRQTHPDRLAVVASLFGLRPPGVEKCRVLELGCAAGGNLIPMAVGLPHANFLGVDLSRVQVAEGQATIEALHLDNIKLENLSILDIDDDFGKFDYIICHGVYSWVPQEVQEGILNVCSRNLQPQGVAYVSYNTFPGWHMRAMVRDMVGYHARQFATPETQVRQARNLLDFLAKSVATEQSPYAMLLKTEVDAIRVCSDSYLLHEHLEEVNDPIYFHQFAERAQNKGLKYLGEAELHVMLPGNFSPEIQSVIQMLSQDHIYLEQYMDFLRNRMFRQTLLCHQHCQPNYQLSGTVVRSLFVGSSVRAGADEVDVTSDDPMSFSTSQGAEFQAREPIVKTAFKFLGELWPGMIHFDDLLSHALMELGVSVDSDEGRTHGVLLADRLLRLYASSASNLVELSVHPPPVAAEVAAKPQASPLARYQAQTSPRVTNLRHESMQVGEVERRLLSYLDGHHDQSQLSSMLAEAVNAGELSITTPESVDPSPELVRSMVATTVSHSLPSIARAGLLMADS